MEINTLLAQLLLHKPLSSEEARGLFASLRIPEQKQLIDVLVLGQAHLHRDTLSAATVLALDNGESFHHIPRSAQSDYFAGLCKADNLNACIHAALRCASNSQMELGRLTTGT